MIFDWFKKPDYTNVVPLFTEPKAVPYVEPPKNSTISPYSIGVTNDNRITLRIGYTTLTLNQQGAENLIRQLELFASQLDEDEV
jgi:hypothetical protein